MKKVYIILMHTNTLPSKLIKLFTGYRYTHVGVSLDKECEKIYSFGRKTLRSFLNGGFVIEKKNGAFFQKFNQTICQIYEIDTNEQAYNKLKHILDSMEEKQELYKYDYLGLFLRYFKIPFYKKNKYVCSYFVASALKKANILKFSKETYFVEPKDFANLKELTLIYEGKYLEYSPFIYDLSYQNTFKVITQK